MSDHAGQWLSSSWSLIQPEDVHSVKTILVLEVVPTTRKPVHKTTKSKQNLLINSHGTEHQYQLKVSIAGI
jgi:hypothetical protein